MTIQILHEKFSNHRVRQSILRLLEENALCSISTVTPRNRAYINTAYFAYSENVELFLYSYPDSQHSKNLERNTSMAITIFRSAQAWGNPDRGMQLFGSCKEAHGKLAVRAERTYASRFPAFKKWKDDLEREEGFGLQAYRFMPASVKLLDEPKFGGGVFIIASLKTC